MAPSSSATPSPAEPTAAQGEVVAFGLALGDADVVAVVDGQGVGEALATAVAAGLVDGLVDGLGVADPDGVALAAAGAQIPLGMAVGARSV